MSRADARADSGHDLAGGNDPPGPAFKALAGWPGFAEAESDFDSETRDAHWAPETEGRLLGLVSELDGLALNRLEADCRESMCRLELLFPTGKEPIYALRQLYQRVGDLELGPAVAETELEGGGQQKLWVFLRRRSTSSPQ